MNKSKNLRHWRFNSVIGHLPSKNKVLGLFCPQHQKRKKKGEGKKKIKTKQNKGSKLGKCGALDPSIQQVPTSVPGCGGEGSASVPVRHVCSSLLST